MVHHVALFMLLHKAFLGSFNVIAIVAALQLHLVSVLNELVENACRLVCSVL